MYKGILVVGAYYDKIKNLMKKGCQKGPKIDAKINILLSDFQWNPFERLPVECF